MRPQVFSPCTVLVLLSFMTVVTVNPAARAGFVTTLSTDVTPSAAVYEYTYTLTNLPQSDIAAYVFALAVDPGAALQSIVIPTGWDVTYNAGDTSITWSSPSALLAVLPGSSSVFGFISAEPPVIEIYDVTGFDPIRFQFYDNAGSTTGPGVSAVPEPSTLIVATIGVLLVLGYVCRLGTDKRGRRSGRLFPVPTTVSFASGSLATSGKRRSDRFGS